jgi:hypothetical protein
MKSRSWCACLLAALVSTAPARAAPDEAARRQELLRRFDFDEYGRQPISFYYCQAGFEPDGYKPVYVWTREEFAQGTALLRNGATGKGVSVPLASHGVNVWGRQDWIADCSGVTTEGEYTLRVEFAGQSAETAPFAISKDCYAELREKAAKHYFLKRCGIFCHTHDANLYSVEPASFGKVLRRVPASGGWHDAHDDNKWVAFAWAAVYGLLKTEERFSPRWQGANEPYPYCLAEAWWEVDWLLRMQKPDGSFYSGVFEWFPTKQGDRTILRVHHREQNYDDLHRDRRAVLDAWGENAICDLLGRAHNTAPSTAPKYFAYCAHVLRCCGRLMRRYDRQKADRCAEAARRAVAYLDGLKRYPPYQELEVNAGLALYWLEEARDGGGPPALAKAEGYLKKMLPLQQPEGHFHSSSTCRGLESWPEEAGDDRVLVDYPFGYMSALIEYLEYARQQEGNACTLVDDVKRAYLRFVRMMERFCNTSTFRQPSEMRIDREPAAIIPLPTASHGYNPYFLSAGRVLAAAERLAGHPGGRRLGQHQLHWVFGANPRFMSFMNQVGVRNSGQYAASSSVTAEHYPMAFYRHLRDMRWGVTTGIYGPQETTAGNSRGQREYNQPVNYPNAGSAMQGRYNSTAQETWLNCNGWLLLLLAELGE